jgi:hypothetical protein
MDKLRRQYHSCDGSFAECQRVIRVLIAKKYKRSPYLVCKAPANTRHIRFGVHAWQAVPCKVDFPAMSETRTSSRFLGLPSTLQRQILDQSCLGHKERLGSLPIVCRALREATTCYHKSLDLDLRNAQQLEQFNVWVSRNGQSIESLKLCITALELRESGVGDRKVRGLWTVGQWVGRSQGYPA